MTKKNNMHPQNGIFLDENGDKHCIITLLKNISSGGGSGVMIELQKGETHIEWKYSNEEDWKQLVSLEELKGTPGERGPQGEAGPQGARGEDGNTWYFGQNAPASSLGKDGDLYYRYSNYDVLKRSGGNWQAAGNLKGSVQDATTSVKGIVNQAAGVEVITKGNVEGTITGTSADSQLETMRILVNDMRGKINDLLTKLKAAGIME